MMSVPHGRLHEWNMTEVADRVISSKVKRNRSLRQLKEAISAYEEFTGLPVVAMTIPHEDSPELIEIVNVSSLSFFQAAIEKTFDNSFAKGVDETMNTLSSVDAEQFRSFPRWKKLFEQHVGDASERIELFAKELDKLSKGELRKLVKQDVKEENPKSRYCKPEDQPRWWPPSVPQFGVSSKACPSQLSSSHCKVVLLSRFMHKFSVFTPAAKALLERVSTHANRFSSTTISGAGGESEPAVLPHEEEFPERCPSPFSLYTGGDELSGLTMITVSDEPFEEQPPPLPSSALLPA